MDTQIWIDSGSTAWVLISAALVMFMTVPALGLFYGGLVKRKNVLAIMMHSFAPLLVVSVIWVMFGYSLAFSDTEIIPGILGDFKFGFLNGISPLDPSPYFVSSDGGRIPHFAFIMFQCMFAVITPAVISGAFAERLKFSSFLLFTVIWTIFIYIPLTHMVWSKNGLLASMGIMDFAGGLVVEINSGFSALAAALIIGKRRVKRISPPHNMTYTVIGAAMLWFGWFGFNAGSGLAADGVATIAFLNTNTTAAIAGLTWVFLDWVLQKKPTILGVATGAVAGLVAITPGAGYINPAGAMILGVLTALVCYGMVMYVKPLLGYDDSLDAFGVHGIAGLIGSLFVGLFADPLMTAGTAMASGKGFAGVFFGGGIGVFGTQALGSLIAMGIAFLGTGLIFFILDKIGKLRVSEFDESIGLDLTQHNERAYTIIE